MSNYAKALQNSSSFVRRWKESIANRLHRIFDDRDSILAEALKLVEERSDSYYPAVLYLDSDLTALSHGGSAVTGVTITGTNLLGDAEQATGATENSTGAITFTAIRPGDQTITITITNDGGALAVDSADADAGTIAITHGSGGAGTGGVATATEVANAIAAHAEAKFMVSAAVTAAGDMDADESITVETSSADPGTLATATFGPESMSGSTAGFGFTAWSDVRIIMDFDPTGTSFTAGDTHLFRLWIDDVLVASLPATITA